MEKRIIYKNGFYYVVQRWGIIVYTYVVKNTEKEAQEVLDFIIKEYGE